MGGRVGRIRIFFDFFYVILVRIFFLFYEIVIIFEVDIIVFIF